MRYWKQFVNTLWLCTNEQMITKCNDAGLVQLNKVYDYSSRIVFAINDKWVIKIALSNAGIEQNEVEYRLHQSLDVGYQHYKKYFAKCLEDYHNNYEYRFVIMERIINSTECRKELIKETRRNGKMYNAIKEIDAHADTMNAGDYKLSNLGKTKTGQIKMLDYGCSRNIVKWFRAAWGMNGNGKDNSDVKRIEF